jgi:hypothetical protein
VHARARVCVFTVFAQTTRILDEEKLFALSLHVEARAAAAAKPAGVPTSPVK